MKELFIPNELESKIIKLGFDRINRITFIEHGEPKDYKIYFKTVEQTEESKYIKWIGGILWQQAFDFFRIEKDLHCTIYQVFDENDKLIWDWNIIDNNSEEEEYDIPLSDTYEEARLKCLTKLIEIVENGK